MLLDNLSNKRVKVSYILATTLGGFSGTKSGCVGVLTTFDDEFVCLDNTTYFKRSLVCTIKVCD